jgi:hypothetical protein
LKDESSPECAIVEMWGAAVVVCYPRPMPSPLNIRKVGDGPRCYAVWQRIPFVEFKCTRNAPWRCRLFDLVLLEQSLEARVVAEGVPHGMIPEKTRVNFRGHRD